MGATASCELATWILLSVVAHALLSAILLLLVLVLKNEFLNNTQWILSVVFDAVAIAESLLSPIVVTRFGITEADAELLYDDAGAGDGYPLGLSPMIARQAPPPPSQQQFRAQKRVRFADAHQPHQQHPLRPAGGGKRAWTGRSTRHSAASSSSSLSDYGL